MNAGVRQHKKRPMQRHGPIARVFIAMNRLFGWFSIAAGTYLVVAFATSAIRAGGVPEPWWPGLLGACFLVAGILYVRAPLTRSAGGESQ